MTNSEFITGKLVGKLEAIDRRLISIENKVDSLQSDLDQRRGGKRVFYAMASLIGAAAGAAGSYLHTIFTKI